MRPSDHPIYVELRCVQNPVYVGEVQGMEIRSEDKATVELTGCYPQYLTIRQTAFLVLRIGKRERLFRLKNSCFAFQRSFCAVLAEEVREMSGFVVAEEFTI